MKPVVKVNGNVQHGLRIFQVEFLAPDDPESPIGNSYQLYHVAATNIIDVMSMLALRLNTDRGFYGEPRDHIVTIEIAELAHSSFSPNTVLDSKGDPIPFPITVELED